MKNDASKIKELGDLAVMTAGYPLRGSAGDLPDGDTAIVQLRNINEDGAILWGDVMRRMLPSSAERYLLEIGDIIFAARGANLVASTVIDPPTQSVCTPHFFALRLKPNAEVDPEFVAWQINQPPAQRFLLRHGNSATQASVPRRALETLPIIIPSLHKQKLFVKLSADAKREKQVLERMIAMRQSEIQSIATQFLRRAEEY